MRGIFILLKNSDKQSLNWFIFGANSSQVVCHCEMTEKNINVYNSVTVTDIEQKSGVGVAISVKVLIIDKLWTFFIFKALQDDVQTMWF